MERLNNILCKINLVIINLFCINDAYFMQHHCSNVPGISCLSVCPKANVQLNAPQTMSTEGQLCHWPKLQNKFNFNQLSLHEQTLKVKEQIAVYIRTESYEVDKQVFL